MKTLQELITDLEIEANKLEDLNFLLNKIRYYFTMSKINHANVKYKRLLSIANAMYFKRTNISIL